MREVLIVDLGAPPPRCEAAFAYTPYQHSAHQVLGRRRSFRPEFSCLIIMQLLVVALTAFTESERFERWSHYKDVSLPGTVHLSVSFKEPGRPAFVPTGVYDTLDQAAIADGACRMLPDASYSGYTYWHYPERVRRVLEALEAAPSTQGPSVFTLSTNATLTR